MSDSAERQRSRANAALVFAAAYCLLWIYWASGGRAGYTACDRTAPSGGAELATGCGADQVARLPWANGWLPAAACAALLIAAGANRLRPNRFSRAGLTTGGIVLVMLSFPAHLLFELPAAGFGTATDWRDVAHRLVQLGGGLICVAAGSRFTSHTATWTKHPVWAYTACAVPILGFTVPHALWWFGIGVPADVTPVLRHDPATLLALCAAPALGGVLSLGLARHWGRVFPRWIPACRGRRVPRALVLLPGGIVAIALVSYGLLGIGIIAGRLADGSLSAATLAANWMTAGTEPVFLVWGLALAAATWGYHLRTWPAVTQSGT